MLWNIFFLLVITLQLLKTNTKTTLHLCKCWQLDEHNVIKRQQCNNNRLMAFVADSSGQLAPELLETLTQYAILKFLTSQTLPDLPLYL